MVGPFAKGELHCRAGGSDCLISKQCCLLISEPPREIRALPSFSLFVELGAAGGWALEEGCTPLLRRRIGLYYLTVGTLKPLGTVFGSYFGLAS